MLAAMTASGPKTIDGNLISRADLERMHNEEEQHAESMRKAAVTVAGMSTDPADARMLFDLLGLDETVLVDARGRLRARHPSKPASAGKAKGAKRPSKKTAA